MNFVRSAFAGTLIFGFPLLVGIIMWTLVVIVAVAAVYSKWRDNRQIEKEWRERVRRGMPPKIPPKT